MKQNILLLFAMVLFCTANAYAQLGKDCTSAATICGTAQIPAPTAGVGDVTDNVPNDCSVSEHNSTWVTFVVTAAGTLTMNFDASPNADIDFALWRIPGGGTIAASCAALTQVGTNDRCDYDSSITESGFGTTCGTGSGCDTEGNLTVAVGDRIIAMVDDFGSFNGFAFTPTVGGTSQRACNTVKCNSCASPICTGSSVYANYAAASDATSVGCNTDEIRIPGSQIQEFCMTFTTPATLTTNEIAFDAGLSRTPGTCGLAFTSETLYSNACGAITSSGTDAASGYPKFPVAPSTTYKYCMTWTGTSCTQIQNPCFRPFYSPAPACVTPTAGITNNESPVSTVITCANPGISVTATGGGTYNWGGGVTTAANTFTSAGTYTVTVTAATGGATCTATASITITSNTTAPSVAASNDGPLTCTKTSVTLSPSAASGTITYAWPGGVTSVSSAGTYTVTATDSANGCTATSSTTVASNTTAPSVTASNDGPLTCTKTSVTLSPSAPSGTITYAWPGGVTSVGSAGTYTVTATDSANGCTATSSTTVVANTTAPTFTGVASCTGGANTGQISQAATGGSGTYTYAGSFGPNLANGTYTITVTDSGTGCTGTGSVTVSCADVCPSLTAQAPAAVVSSNSTCSLCALSGGVIAVPTTNCPAGSTLQYSTDAGTTWSTTLPTYNQTTAVTVLTRCNCDVDNTLSSPTNTVTTVPGTCTAVTASAGSNSPVACGGTISLTSSGGTSYSWTGPGGFTSTAQNPTRTTANATMAGTYTVTVTGANGCNATASTVVSVGACTTTTINLMLLDPCTCNNDASISVSGTPALPVQDGTFSELVHTPTGAIPAGLVLNVEAVTGLTGVAIGDDFTYNATDMWYEIPGTHVDNVGYTISVKLYEADGVTPFDGDPGTPGVQEVTASIGNKCAYPNPDFSIGSFVDCNTAIALTTTHSTEGNGMAAYSGTGVSGTTFTPTGLTGAQTIALTYTGINDGNSGISPDSGTTPAFPGCQEVIQKSVTVNCPACQASPNMQWGN